MKQNRIEYSNNRIVYWPFYEAATVGVIYLLVIGALFIAASIWMLLDNPSSETNLGIQLIFLLGVVALCTTFRFVSRRMHTRIIISNEGIRYKNGNFQVEKQIRWDDVSLVYFCQEHWYGTKACKIFYKTTLSYEHHKKYKCDFLLPVYDVDEQKLLRFIPNYLWGNKPWHS